MARTPSRTATTPSRSTSISGTSKLLGSDTVPVHVANQIASPAPALKLTYHWAAQPRRHLPARDLNDGPREPARRGRGAAPPATPGAAGADQVLQSAELRSRARTENASAAKSLLRDIIISGTVTDHSSHADHPESYNIQPRLRTVNARGAVLASENYTTT